MCSNYCIASGCDSTGVNWITSTSSRKPGFHKFPHKYPEVMREWLKAVHLKRKLKKNSVLCSKHFTSESYVRGIFTTTLIRNAVPSLFLEPNAKKKGKVNDPKYVKKPVLIICVSLYFLIMGLLILYTTYKEKGIFVISIQKDPTGFTPDKTWEASSYLKKYDDKYNLVLICKDGKTGAVREAKMTKSAACFIDDNRVIVNELIEPEVSKLQNRICQDRKDK